ncbi:IS110 family transposase [Thermoanaerobacteraceae bacterium SP2]|nr:IS110 family transposase [Thermoanaerobacteraceae bacterium SP2]
MLYVGIDWADTQHRVSIIDSQGVEKANFTIPHTREGLEHLKEKLIKLAQNPQSIACIIETKHGLLIQFLLEAGFAVYPVNPKVVDRRRKPSGAKSDPLDARILAELGRTDINLLRQLKPDSELIQELKVLTRDQDTLIRESTRLTNRLISCLKEYFPVALELFSKPTLPVTLDFLKQYPTLESAQIASVPELAAFLKSHKHPKPNQTASEIYQKLHSPQLKANPVVTRTKARLMLAILSQLEPLLEQIKEYDKEIERLFKLHSDSKFFASLPGAGLRLAPRLLAEWGDDRERFLNASVVQALAGTSPVLYQSGKYCFAKQRKSCVKPFRNVLHQFAYQTVMWVGWSREYYDKKRSEGKSHHEAIRALANIWVRIIFAMWKSYQPYDESIFLSAKAKHSLAAA